MPNKPTGRTRKPSGASRGATANRKRSGKRGPAPAARSRRVSTPAARIVPAARTPKSTVRPAMPVDTRPPRPLGRRELEEFRRMLTAERDRLAEELETIEQHLPEVEQVALDATGGYDEDLADVASDTFEREKGIAIENSVQDMLHQVEEALGRIEAGTFGICQSCGQPINPDRLRALPYARLCIRCKAREEQAIHR